MQRSLSLYSMSFKALTHKVRHDLAKEIVVAICAAVVLGLFSYIFNDFINNEAQKISSRMRDGLALGMTYLIFAVAALLAPRRLVSDLRDERSIGSASGFYGETPSTVRSFRGLLVVGDYLVLNLAALYITSRWFVTLNIPGYVAVIGGMTLFSLAVAMFAARDKRFAIEPDFSKRSIAYKPLSRERTLYRWRLHILLKRNRLTRLTVAFVVIPLMMLGLTGWSQSSHVVGVLLSYVGSLFIAAALCFQVSDDLGHAWLEKTFGISHDEYVKGLSLLGRVLGVTFGILCFGVWFATNLHSLPLRDLVMESVKIGLVGMVAPLVNHSLVFQIDARKPFVQILTVALVCLFVDTAILAHPAGVLLVPLLLYYGQTYQKGSYYRA